MSETTTRSESRMRYLCEAYQLGISIRNGLNHTGLVTAVEQQEYTIDAIDDGYPAWHPAPLSFRAMVLAFVFMGITGESYTDFTRRLAQQPEVMTALGFSRVPDESALSRAWRKRFNATGQEYIETAAHFVVKEVHDTGIPAPEVRSKSDIVEPANESDEESDANDSFSTDDIVRTT